MGRFDTTESYYKNKNKKRENTISFVICPTFIN